MSEPAPRPDKAAEIKTAMERLLTGRPIHTDGTLDISTLAVEAGVSRQDLYRAHRPILEEFRSHVRRLAAAGPRGRQSEQVDRLTEQRDDALGRAGRYRRERDAARRERDANASQVVYLAEQNRLLRTQLDAQSSVTPIR